MPDHLSSYLYADEKLCVDRLLAAIEWSGDIQTRTAARTADMIRRIRSAKRQSGELETFLRAYGLNTNEGLALMGLAEALLRIPDSATANALIRDKIFAADWTPKGDAGEDILVRLSGLGLSAARKTLGSMVGKAAEPVIRESIKKSLQTMGAQFVLGRTIGEAQGNAKKYTALGYAMSYDMLGEGARTDADAKRCFEAYINAAENLDTNVDATISVKLSALHPRYEYAQGDTCIPALTEKLLQLCTLAKSRGIGVTIDAEESYRLEISIEILEKIMADSILKDWDRLGLAVQAYQKRAFPLIDRIADMGRKYGRRIEMRLVKGAYWDTEIKRAQVMGLPDYPVFSRKVNTDLSYLACAKKMLQQKDVLYPMFATHNAQTACAILEMAGKDLKGFEFQRLHGMGQTLHDLLLRDEGVKSRIYAPVGSYEELLPYLVRRLLENGANSSFVNRILDPSVAPEVLADDPVASAAAHPHKRHDGIPLPINMFTDRKNSEGTDLSDESTTEFLLQQISAARFPVEAAPLIAGKTTKTGKPLDLPNPAKTGSIVGQVWHAQENDIARAFAAAKEAFPAWTATPAETRAASLEAFADLLEEHKAAFMSLCVSEAGKTIADAIAEVREAVDFCRYYARQGRKAFAESGTTLPGPTGESNVLTLHGRGIFVCISPWNFPLAIFTGQIAAALMAGNAVIAKPAEQTPLIATLAVQMMHKAGIPPGVLNLLPGDGDTGAKIVAHQAVDGVAFTGSTGAAKAINRALAGKDGPIVPLIAETGGLNAMIADSSALPERVVDDAVLSAFGSTGQRCSALRILLLQEDIADKTIEMLKGAMAHLRVDDPSLISTDIGPVIDAEALETLRRHVRGMEPSLLARAPLNADTEKRGHFFAPCLLELKDIGQLDREVFGPVLHVLRYRAKDLDEVIARINAKGYGLTFGMHTRIAGNWQHACNAIQAGNCYVNRSMIGAVVGVQPFGGQGLSGTGPKAGGPHYLHRFATEKTVTVDTTASGGNASLVSLGE